MRVTEHSRRYLKSLRCKDVDGITYVEKCEMASPMFALMLFLVSNRVCTAARGSQPNLSFLGGPRVCIVRFAFLSHNYFEDIILTFASNKNSSVLIYIN